MWHVSQHSRQGSQRYLAIKSCQLIMTVSKIPIIALSIGNAFKPAVVVRLHDEETFTEWTSSLYLKKIMGIN